MAASISEQSQRPGGSVLKRWSWRLAIAGLCVELLCLTVRVSISIITLRFFTDLSHDFPPFLGIGISLLILLIYKYKYKLTEFHERSLTTEQEADAQGKLPSLEESEYQEKNKPPEMKKEPLRQIVQLSPYQEKNKPPEMKKEPPQQIVQLSPVLNRQPFIVPLEGNNPNECEDKAAVNAAGDRYAVTDGVAQSFMPAQWAEVIARYFVEHSTDFSTETDQGRQDFFLWLQECSKEWEQWVRREQLPQLKKDYSWTSWDEQVAEGAQTTFIGCSLFAAPDQVITVHVTAIGDAYFFLFRNIPPSSQEKENGIEMWPPETPRGDNKPNTFKTLAAVEPERADARALRSLKALKQRTYRAHVGDIIVLVTDKLALWIWQQMTTQPPKHLNQLLTLPDAEAFRQFVFDGREARTLAHDDTTLFLIPLNNELYQRLLSPKPRSTKPILPQQL